MKAETSIGPVTIVGKSERHYVGIRLQTPFPGMFAVVAKALKELRKWTKTNGLPEDGPYFLRYYHCDMEGTMDVEAGLILSEPHQGEGNITPGTLPGGQYASLTYRGNGLRGNQALMKWAKDNHVTFAPIDPALKESYVCRYEAYLTDYRKESRKLLWDVELSIMVQM